MAMMHLQNTLEVWKGEFKPEVGNLSTLGGINRQGEIGIVITVFSFLVDNEQIVEVSWKARKPRKAQAHQAAQRDRAATAQRVVTGNWLDASDKEYRNG